MKKINKRSNPKNNLNYRTLPIRAAADGTPSTLDEDSRSVEVVGTTEDRVQVFDYARWEVIDEILLMSGCEMPGSRQVPLLDTHSRYDSYSVLGSYRDMLVDGDQLVGRSYFSTAPEAESPYTKMREGHLTDFSVGYLVIDSTWVADGEEKVIGGRTFEGPVSVVTRWRVKELSICPIGADERAKARTEHNEPKSKQEKENMDEKLRKYLESRGLRADATEAEAWSYLEKLEIPKAVDMPDVEKERAEAVRIERERITEIRAMCDGLEIDMADELISGGATLDSARKTVQDKLIEARKETKHRTPMTHGEDEKDKFRTAATDAVLIRAGMSVEKPVLGADDLAGYSLRELARHSLRIANLPTGGGVLEMVGRAMTTSDFPYLLANVANKSLFKGFETASETWRTWCDIGSVSDFKTNYLPRVSESSDLDEVPEDVEYKYGKRTEAQETYSVLTYGKIFPISRQCVINDDLNALTTIAAAHGEAVQRKLGDIAYAVLTANADMGDGAALFVSDHGNIASGGDVGAPGIATLAAAILAMGTQKDLQGLRRLNISPEFFIAPKALEGVMRVFFKSEKYADSDTVATDSSLAATRANPYSGGYFTQVYEPRLDDTSSTAWYLAGPKGKTVKMFFLDGKQTPYMENRPGFTVDGFESKVRIDAGAKAVHWAALYYNAGT